jgi:hypothetical protein
MKKKYYKDMHGIQEVIFKVVEKYKINLNRHNFKLKKINSSKVKKLY